jgi:outer membrane protein TolC
MMRLETKMRKKAISIAKSGYRPSINFVSSLQFQAQYDENKWPDRNMWSRSSYSGVTISIPIFDSWRTPSKVKQAKIELVQAELSEKELEENIILEIEQSWWDYHKARESLTAQGQAVEMAKRGLDIASVRYENGVGTQLELFEAEVALAEAETNRVRAFYQLVTGYAALQKALGEEELIK